jgi:hypothetical protein
MNQIEKFCSIVPVKTERVCWANILFSPCVRYSADQIDDNLSLGIGVAILGPEGNGVNYLLLVFGKVT